MAGIYQFSVSILSRGKAKYAHIQLMKGENELGRVFAGDIVASYHAREPLYSNSAVIAWCSQSTGAQNILFWHTLIHSMSQYFTTFNFHEIFFHLELLLW